jgi:hypothetical protein
MNTAELVPAVRELFSQYARAARLAPEQLAGLLWILCYVGDHDEPPECFEVAAALEALDIETGREAA